MHRNCNIQETVDLTNPKQNLIASYTGLSLESCATDESDITDTHIPMFKKKKEVPFLKITIVWHCCDDSL